MMNVKNIKIVTHMSEDGKIQMSVMPPIPFPDFLQIQLSAIASAMHATVDAAPTEEDQKVVRDDIYNLFNVAAASLLDQLDPEPAHKFSTGLTEAAILKAENEIIEAEFAKQARLEAAKPKDHKAPVSLAQVAKARAAQVHNEAAKPVTKKTAKKKIDD